LEIKNTYSRIIGIAYPIILGHLAENVINITDTIFVGRLGDVPLGAVGLGSLYYYTFVLIALGLAMGAQILIGRRNGEKDYHGIGRLMDTALATFAGIAVVLFITLKLFSPMLLHWLVKGEEVYQLTLQYVSIRSYGILFIALSVVFRAFYIGITKTRVIVWITLVMALVNVLFNQLLIFGYAGFPVMGIRGSATASLIAEFMAVAGYITYTFFRKGNEKYSLFRFNRTDKDTALSILKVGFPIMLQSWISVASWFLFFMFIERMGARSLGVSTIIKNVYLIMMLPVWGFSSAANTLVSNAMGRERYAEVPFIVRRVVTISLSLIILLASVNIFFPEIILGIYTNKPDVIQQAEASLRIVSFAVIVYSMGGVMFNAVSGTGATKISLRIELVTLSLYIAYTLITGWVYQVPLYIFWAAEIVYMSAMLLGSYLYLRSGKWKSIRL
jgi:putative MATE family efflux protein